MTIKIEYYSGAWLEKADASLVKTIEILNEQDEFTFVLPNTSSNRTFVLTNYDMRLYYDAQIFVGVLKAIKYSAQLLTCTAYDKVFITMKTKVITANYPTSTPALLCLQVY